ncbi:hypothetical protein O6H91_10G050000 [Diphasiastrum complanatum]|uniref:Uncharacterized protein n=1 Tax=Diphasiastrum complanatum TaxID=34168 RepID=A0ACC2CGZ6_DIPCM|nr:hypothetical protein O6H91_10G050000 [Diphasiastrum complanatum]
MVSADLSPDVQSMLCDAHPLLKGGRPPYAHSWNSDQIRVLGAICDTFVPSLPVEALNATFMVRTKAVDAYCSEEDVDALYRTSASDLKIPEEVAGMIFKWLKPHLVYSLGIILWLLSTRIGTLMLCGSLSFTEHFPYIQSFPKLSNHKKEQVLLGWKRSSISAFQSLFKILKSFCLWNFYATADENGENQVWKAIGFCKATMQSLQSKSIDSQQQDSGMCRSSYESVLKSRVFDADAGVKALHQFLTHVGCSPLEDLSCLVASCNNPVLNEDIGIKSDVVVVGSGSGGAVIAGALAQKGYSVLVVEKGKYFSERDLSLLEGPTIQSMYEGGGMMGTEDGGVNILAGSTLGGGSAVNWSASICTPRHVLREWAEDHGLSFFASEDYQKAMQEVCKRLGVQASVREESFQNAVLRKGCEELGYHVANIPRNAGPDHACGFCGLGCKSGEKQATTKTWLVDAAAADAVILTGCRVEKVLYNSLKDKNKKPSRIEGIQASLSDGSRLFIQAKSVVVACGSLMTPILLQKSGLQNQNIGKFLHIHPTQMVWGYFPKESGPKGRCYEGTIMTAVSEAAANWESSGYGALLEVPALLPGGFAGLMPWCSGADSKRRISRYSRTAHCIVLARDKGSGMVKVDKRGYPSIFYKLSPEDEESLKQGADKALRVLIAAGAQEIGTHHPDGEELQIKGATITEIEDYLWRVRSKSLTQVSMSLCSAHQMGSCRMGIDPSSSVVDPKGESWDVEGLFIGDTSVFPTASGVNPMITVQSIAFCTAKRVNEYLKDLSI